MAADDSVSDVMERLHRGSGEAATLVFRRFAHRLIALARNHLAERLRPKVDAEDVVQSVFRSFFGRCADGQFAIDDWDGLWGLLVRVTLRKCGRQAEYFRAACRDARREDRAAGAARAVAEGPPCPQPTPEEVALLADTAEQVMARLGTARKRAIFELSLQGYTVPEISARVGFYERGVERVRAEVRRVLERQLDSARGP
jgi:RNA polymerase sigma-70 factor (ECF subfamily)